MYFINRKEEIKFLNNHFNSEPNSILFVYGPKSSGKSSLINKIVDENKNKNLVFHSMSLRSLLITNFNSFLDRFFYNSTTDKIKQSLKNITINTPFIDISGENIGLFYKNPFELFNIKMRDYRSKGKTPIIIIDEIQLLKNIYVNGERYLLDELFNLFIELTKTKHLAHIVLATSDSYFIEEIYNNAKLMKTTNLYFVDHFDRTSVDEWLDLEKFTSEEKDTVWEYLGGSPWEITELIQQKKNGNNVKEICLEFVNNEYSKIFEYRNKMKEKDKEYFETFEKINKIIAKEGFYQRNDNEKAEIVNSLIKDMVDKDFWFYRVITQKITANCKSLEWAFKNFKK